MEEELHRRDHIGVQDFVLLEDYTSPEAFIDNLQKRFQEDLIYVSHKWAVTRDFQQQGILTSADSDKPTQPPFKLRNSK